MTELRPHGRELLEVARVERTPSAADRERVLAALLAGAALLTTASAAAAPSLLSKLGTGTVKWWLLGGLASVVAGRGYWGSRSTPLSAPTPAPVAVAAPPVVAPVTVPALDAPVTPPPVLAPRAEAPRTSAEAVRQPSTPPSLERELAALHADNRYDVEPFGTLYSGSGLVSRGSLGLAVEL